MADRHYGHLACDGREHAIRLLDQHSRLSETRRPPSSVAPEALGARILPA
jgi:hypothetical protein